MGAFLKSIAILLSVGGAVGTVSMMGNAGTEVGKETGKGIRDAALLATILGIGMLWFARKKS